MKDIQSRSRRTPSRPISLFVAAFLATLLAACDAGGPNGDAVLDEPLVLQGAVSGYDGPGTGVDVLVMDAEGYVHETGGGYLTSAGNLTLTLQSPPVVALATMTDETVPDIGLRNSDTEARLGMVHQIVTSGERSGFLHLANGDRASGVWDEQQVGDAVGGFWYADRPTRLTYDYHDSFGNRFSGDMEFDRGWNIVADEITRFDGDVLDSHARVVEPTYLDWYYQPVTP